MSNDVQFDEWRPGEERNIPPSGIAGLVMKWFGITSESIANKILLIAALIFFGLTLFVIFTMIL